MLEQTENKQQPKPEVKPEVKLQLTKAEWDRTLISYSNCAASSKQKFEFNYLGVNKITNVKGSCGCTDVIHKDNVITGVWNLPKDVSQQKGQIYNANVMVTVTFEDKTTTTLNLTASINKLLFI